MKQTVKNNLGQALRLMLKPLVKLLISQGITHKEFSDAAKEAYVEMALRMQSAGKQNRSRAAIVTGLTRKEVSNVISRAESEEVQGRVFSRPGKVLHGWHNDQRYLGPYGLPNEIPYDSKDKDVPSFVELVKTYSGDQSATQMLDELMTAGAIVRLDDDTLKVVRRDFEPQSLSPKLIERFGDISFNLFSTLSANVQKTGQGEGVFDRVVIANKRLTESELKQFRNYLTTDGQQFLVNTDNFLTRIAGSSNVDGEEPSYETGLAMEQYIVIDQDEKKSLREFLAENCLGEDDEE